jgi:hydroxymethylpyrimidine/phosphomethylpyrimidine kinase
MKMQQQVRKVLTIAGSDSGGGAGIQADLKTFQELGVFGMTAITAVTAQNTLGVQGVYPLPVEAVVRQLDSIGEDLPPQAVKTGMLFSSAIIEAVAERLRHYGWGNLVVDPVMIAKGGAALLQDDAVGALRRFLLPLAEVVTPNIPEAEALAGLRIATMRDRHEAAERILQLGAKHVLIKGGHANDETGAAVDVLYSSDGSAPVEFAAERIATRHTHGTGCTFAAALAAELGKGASAAAAAKVAKAFIHAAIAHPLEIGQGHGPTNHWAWARSGIGG